MDRDKILEKIRNINFIISKILKEGEIEYINVFNESGPTTLRYYKVNLNDLFYKKNELKNLLNSLFI